MVLHLQSKVLYSSLTEVIFLSMAFCLNIKLLWQKSQRSIFIQEVLNMNFSPTLDEVKKIVATGKYDVLPVSCEILSDYLCTPHASNSTILA